MDHHRSGAQENVPPILLVPPPSPINSICIGRTAFLIHRLTSRGHLFIILQMTMSNVNRIGSFSSDYSNNATVSPFRIVLDNIESVNWSNYSYNDSPLIRTAPKSQAALIYKQEMAANYLAVWKQEFYLMIQDSKCLPFNHPMPKIELSCLEGFMGWKVIIITFDY